MKFVANIYGKRSLQSFGEALSVYREQLEEASTVQYPPISIGRFLKLLDCERK